VKSSTVIPSSSGAAGGIDDPSWVMRADRAYPTPRPAGTRDFPYAGLVIVVGAPPALAAFRARASARRRQA
jgi:hypothetical protein